MPSISIVIPTLNEEQQLPHLIKSLQAQSFQDFELIVADGGSQDQTRALALEAGAKVVDGGLPGVGRNRGAEAAQGEFLFFFDADVVLPPDFLEKAYHELQENYEDLATCEFRPLSDHRLDKILFKMSNLYVKLNLKINPRAPGFCIFISKRLFNRIGGFDEGLHLGEDHDLVQRASQFRPLRFLKTTFLEVSIRRLEKEGRFGLVEKYIQAEWHMITKGNIQDKQSIKYEFADFDSNSKEKTGFLDQVEKKLLEMDKLYDRASDQEYSQWSQTLGEIKAWLEKVFPGKNKGDKN